MGNTTVYRQRLRNGGARGSFLVCTTPQRRPQYVARHFLLLSVLRPTCLLVFYLEFDLSILLAQYLFDCLPLISFGVWDFGSVVLRLLWFTSSSFFVLHASKVWDGNIRRT